MTDRSTSRELDPVPEGDLAEQSMPAYPNEAGYADDGGVQDDSIDREIAAALDRDGWNANTADLIEQSIPVPLDDEPDPA
ncbi:hypothetical protein [Nocardia sp. NPDC049149]|uniref:hypothetical protein n=1 Tax=Nocardia sp. NPDC049149 TaxID=3364315 RepID=UPI0037194B38